MSFYKSLFRPLLFRIDAERAHNHTIALCRFVGKRPLLVSLMKSRRAQSDSRSDSARLAVEVAGMHFASPVALGAGFDKNANVMTVLSHLGFGAIEIGAVSAEPCAGNAGCRAIRLVDDRSVVTRYGVPNDGAKAVVPRFENHERSIPVGVNIIWNNSGNPSASIHEIVDEITFATSQFLHCVDYVTINFACPNLKGGSHFDEIDNIRILLDKLDTLAPALPVFLKLKHHDGDDAWLDEFLRLTGHYSWISGFIPIVHSMRDMGDQAALGGHRLRGSISGALIKKASLDMLRIWYKKIDRQRHALVATGGLESAQDVYDSIAAGASFVQIFAAMIFEGPYLAQRINRDLISLMKASGIESIAALRGRSNA